MQIGITEIILIVILICAFTFPNKTKEYAKKFYLSKKIIQETKKEVEDEKKTKENEERVKQEEAKRKEYESNAIRQEILHR